MARREYSPRVALASTPFKPIRFDGLVLRPRERVAGITKLFARGFSVELPVDGRASAVGPAIPRAALAAERWQIGDSSLAEALPGKQADLDFRLVQPASV